MDLQNRESGKEARYEQEELEADFECLTVDEAAALLKINRKTLYDAISRDEIPGVRRIGRCVRLCRTTLIAWFRNPSPDARRQKP